MQTSRQRLRDLGCHLAVTAAMAGGFGWVLTARPEEPTHFSDHHLRTCTVCRSPNRDGRQLATRSGRLGRPDWPALATLEPGVGRPVAQPPSR